jgi:hypothetical protein
MQINGGKAAAAKVMLLPLKRSNNVGVYLKKLKLAPAQARVPLSGWEGAGGWAPCRRLG